MYQTASSGHGDHPERPQSHGANQESPPAGHFDSFWLQALSSIARQLRAELCELSQKC
jgi:hypothetical protein